MKRFNLNLAISLIMACALTKGALGNISLLVEEPYGFFGSINPTGHSALYLNHVCADSPTVLRRCEPGETGVVISRYSRVKHLDWVAIPLVPYLYAVEDVGDVPERAESINVGQMREAYAEAHLGALSSAIKKSDTKNVWPQLLGVAYIRKIYSFEVTTTEAQDDLLIAELNDRANQSHFNLFSNNCADFARSVINLYYPRALGRSITADAGITTPKHIAKNLVTYARSHDQLELTEFVIPQVPGNIPRSHTNRGVIESLVKTKKYMIPIAVLHPYVMAGIAVTYLTRGRFELENHAPVIPVADQVSVLVADKPDFPVGVP